MIIKDTSRPIRISIGNADGLTSHSWRIWAERNSELYLACRDAFKDIKVSLHSSGRWRMGFTEEAVRKDPGLVDDGRNRAWDVWDKPPPILPGLVVAFSIYFPSSEFSLRPEQRTGKSWDGVRYIAPARAGRVNVLTLCVGSQGMPFEPGNFYLGRFTLANGTWAHVVAHDADEHDVVAKMKGIRQRIDAEMKCCDSVMPADAFGYFLGNRPDGCRTLVGIRGVPSDMS